MPTDLALLRLLQLVSPALPIGMYSYSQGLETAVDQRWVLDEATASSWLRGQLQHGLCYVDIPILARLYDAWAANAETQVARWSEQLLSYRETAELRAEDRQGGRALARVLVGLGVAVAGPWETHPKVSLAASFALAAHAWNIPRHASLLGYLWAWLENQVLAAVKLIPLGQSAGQRLLQSLTGEIPALIEKSLGLADADLGGSTPGLVLASSRHEVQYSRLFRS